MNTLMTNPTVMLMYGSLMGLLLSKGSKGSKTIFTNLKNRFIHTVLIDQGNDLFRVVSQFVHTTWPEKCRTTTVAWNKSDKGFKLMYWPSQGSFIIRYRGKKLSIKCDREKMTTMNYDVGLYFSTLEISGFFARKVINELLEEAMAKFAQGRPNGAIGVFAKSHEKMDEVNEVYPKPLNALIYKDNKGSKIKADIDDFLASEEWYTKRGISYKRCYCLYGPPGTGKTSLVLSIAGALSRDVYMLDIGKIVDEEQLVRAVAGIPCGAIVVLEDIDRTLNRADFKLSISSLLNVLDGPFTKKGMIWFLTTNHLDQIDPAILRDGRVDVKEEIGLASAREVEKYFHLFFGKPVTIHVEMEVSLCTVQEICIRNKNNAMDALKEIVEL